MRAHLATVSKELVKNPISASLLGGALINFAGIPIYQPMMGVLELVSRAGIPAALIALGAGLNRYEIRGEIPMALSITGIKLVVLPAIVWFLTFVVFDMDIVWSQTAVLLSCMPVGISVYVFSIRYHTCENLAASAIVISCLLSIFSISFYAYLLGV